MRELLSEAREIVAAAESAIKPLLAKAAEAGEYSDLRVLVSCAEALSEIRNTRLVNYHGASAGISTESGRHEATARNSISTGDHLKGLSGSKRRRTPNRRGKYPMFLRAGDSLVKIGWSKSKKSEYEHRATYACVMALISAVLGASRGNGLVRVDQLQPLRVEPDDEVPAYQIYVCLAWFRKIGIVRQRGRQGFVLTAAAKARDIVNEEWSKLSEMPL
jgi:hypothetical protein